jgi:hypothetical protein
MIKSFMSCSNKMYLLFIYSNYDTDESLLVYANSVNHTKLNDQTNEAASNGINENIEYLKSLLIVCFSS